MHFSPKLAEDVLDQKPERKVITNILKSASLSGLNGFPPLDRCLTWLCLSKILPLETNKWESTIQILFDSYLKYIEIFDLSDFLLDSFQITNADFQQLYNQIHVDILRTTHHIKFLPFPNGEMSDTNVFEVFSQHIKRIERILLVFTFLNVNMGYVQGFNELVIPIFYVFLSAVSGFNFNWDIVEALSFYLLQTLITTTSLHALYSIQNKWQFSLGKIDQFSQILKTLIPHVWKKIDGFNIHPMQYSFRWLALIFAQDQEIPQLVTIWDALFANFDCLVEYCYFIGVAQIKMHETDIMDGSFKSVMNLLQNIHVDDIKLLLHLTKDFWINLTMM